MPTAVQIEDLLKQHDEQFKQQPRWSTHILTRNSSAKRHTSAIHPQNHLLKKALQRAEKLSDTNQKIDFLKKINQRIAQLLQKMILAICKNVHYPIQTPLTFIQEDHIFLNAKEIDVESGLLFSFMENFIGQLLNPEVSFSTALQHLRRQLDTTFDQANFQTHFAYLEKDLKKLKIHLHQILDQYDASALAFLKKTVLKIDTSRPLPESFDFDALLQNHPDKKWIDFLKTTENYHQLQQLFFILRNPRDQYEHFPKARQLLNAMTGIEKTHLTQLFHTYEYIAFESYLFMLEAIRTPAEDKTLFSPDHQSNKYFKHIDQKKHFLAAQRILKYLSETERLKTEDHMSKCMKLLESIEVPFLKTKQDFLIEKIKFRLNGLMQRTAINALSASLVIEENISDSASVLTKITNCKLSIERDRTLQLIIHSADYKIIIAIFQSLLTASVPILERKDYLSYSLEQCQKLTDEKLKDQLHKILHKFNVFKISIIKEFIKKLNEKEISPLLMIQWLDHFSNYKFIKCLPDVVIVIEILTHLQTKKTPMISRYGSYDIEPYVWDRVKKITDCELKASVTRIIRKMFSSDQDEDLAETAIIYIGGNESVSLERSKKSIETAKECFIRGANEFLRQIKTELDLKKSLCSRYIVLFFYFKIKVPDSVAKGVERIAEVASKEENFSIHNEGIVKAKNFISTVDSIIMARQQKKYGFFRHRNQHTHDFYEKWSQEIEKLKPTFPNVPDH